MSQLFETFNRKRTEGWSSIETMFQSFSTRMSRPRFPSSKTFDEYFPSTTSLVNGVYIWALQVDPSNRFLDCFRIGPSVGVVFSNRLLVTGACDGRSSGSPLSNSLVCMYRGTCGTYNTLRRSRNMKVWKQLY